MAKHRVPVSEVMAHSPERLGSLTILADRRVRLAQEPESPHLRYTANKYTIVHEEGREEYGLYDSSNYFITLWHGNDSLFTFTIHRHRVVDAMFSVVPDVRRIARWVALVREAGFGEWVTPALFNTLRSMTLSPYLSRPRLTAMQKLITRSIRDDLASERARTTRPAPRRRARRP